MVTKYEHILPEGWKSTFIISCDQIETIRSIWEKMQAEQPCPAINADIDRYLSVLDASDGQSTPLILLLEHNDQPKAMLIGRREKHAVTVCVGYKTLLRPKLHCMTVVYGGVLGQPDEQVSSLLFGEMKKLLRTGEVDIVRFNHLRVDSVFYRQVRRLSFLLCRNCFPIIEPHWRMTIPENIDEFYASRSKKHRKHLHHYKNRIEREFPGKVTLRTYTKSEEVQQAVEDVVHISQNTYQSAMGAGFNCSQQILLLKTAAAQGWFRGHILYINDEPAAFRIALKYHRIYFGDGIGYTHKWKDFRIGTILFLKVLEHICQENKVDYYDFGFGDADYKQSYGNESWQEVAATYLFAPRIYPLLINLISSLNSGFTLALTMVFQETRVFSWVKRLWRKKLKETAIKSEQGN